MDQPSAPAWMRSLSPSGDKLKDWTEALPNSWRGNPDSLTIHSPPDEPAVLLAAKATQRRSWRIEPVLKTRLWARTSWLPSASRAAVVNPIVYVVAGASREDGAITARRPSAGSSRTLKGTDGEMVIAPGRLAPFISRVKLRIR